MTSNPLTSSAEEFPANHGRSPASDWGQKMTAIFGLISGDVFAYFDRESSSWRKCQGSLWEEDSSALSETLRRAGTMRDGELYPLQPWERLTSASGYSSSGPHKEPFPTPSAAQYGSSGNGEGNNVASRARPSLERMWQSPMPSDVDGGRTTKQIKNMSRWPTATAGDAKSSGSRNLPGSRAHDGVSLTDAVQTGDSQTPRWPTPRTITGGAESGQRKKELGRTESGGGDLQAAVRSSMDAWPTPGAQDHKSGKGFDPTGRGHTPQLRHIFNGVLNPRWVETLMGFPVGWGVPGGESLAGDPSPPWPTRPGEEQPDGEPERTVEPFRGRPAQLRALGNAVVPQVAEMLGNALLEASRAR